ncbi:MAG: hypothetical protein KF884_06770 [Fimbriimonadaceae bacterium]|nr:hypothetical protein [Fimbriimonadaceae bacterium]QYK57253.1 MAG: hypothetical protein KF884_06770 [Fimbriimonadaceae bacterium]
MGIAAVYWPNFGTTGFLLLGYPNIYAADDAATAVTMDGTRIVGYAFDGLRKRAVRWQPVTGVPAPIGGIYQSGLDEDRASDVSATGSVEVGYYRLSNTNRNRILRVVDGVRVEHIYANPNDTRSFTAFGVSPDGNFTVGVISDTPINFEKVPDLNVNPKAFLTKGPGAPIDLKGRLNSLGANIPSGVTLLDAQDVTVADGTIYVVGNCVDIAQPNVVRGYRAALPVF